MGLLDPDLINKELPFEAMPDACILTPTSKIHINHPRKLELPEMVYVAFGARLINLQMIFYPYDRCEGWIMDTSLNDMPYDPRWGDGYPRNDYFSNRWSHMEEMLERHTHGMLNIERLKQLNRIWNEMREKSIKHD